MSGLLIVAIVVLVVIVAAVLAIRSSRHKDQAGQEQRDVEAETDAEDSPEGSGSSEIRNDEQQADDSGHVSDDSPAQVEQQSEDEGKGELHKPAERSVDPQAMTAARPKTDPPPPERVLVNAAAATDVGLKRKNNEDAFAVMPEYNIYAIADGMGRHAAGEVASKLTIEAITDAVERHMFLHGKEPAQASADEEKQDEVAQRLVKIVERANRVVLTMSNEIPDFYGMGTTVVLAQFSPSKHMVHIAHVGDSRCYRIRDGQITQLTTDHTLGSLGIRGKTSSLLARAVGIEENIQVDVTVDHPNVGDVYLLCSDGLSGMASDEDILHTVEAHRDLDEATEALIDLAKKGGGQDNVTIVLVRVDEAAN